MYMTPLVLASDVEVKQAKWIKVQSANTVVLKEGDVGTVKPALLEFALDGTCTFQVILKTVKTGDWKFSDELPCPSELMGILDSTLSKKPSSGSVVLTSDSHACTSNCSCSAVRLKQIVRARQIESCPSTRSAAMQTFPCH